MHLFKNQMPNTLKQMNRDLCTKLESQKKGEISMTLITNDSIKIGLREINKNESQI